jgi:Mg2+ and Co2+ transporter CorA
VVLRQFSNGADGFSAIASERGELRAGDAHWIDATDPDEAELVGAARLLGLSNAVVAWMQAANASTLAGAVDDALTFVFTAPTVDGADGERPMSTTIVFAMTKHQTFTVHDDIGERVVVDAARRAAGQRLGNEPFVAVLSVITEIVDRYDGVVTELGASQQAHSAEIVGASDGRQSAKDVVAHGLRLAVDIGDHQARLRRLRQTVARLRALTSGLDLSSSVAGSIDACARALDALDADLDALNHRLEMATDAQLSLLSSRQGEISKTIAAWAGIFAANAVITGWYGMNIVHLPGSGSWATVAIIMLCVSAALIVQFRRSGWL